MPSCFITISKGELCRYLKEINIPRKKHKEICDMFKTTIEARKIPLLKVCVGFEKINRSLEEFEKEIKNG